MATDLPGVKKFSGSLLGDDSPRSSASHCDHGSPDVRELELANQAGADDECGNTAIDPVVGRALG